MPASDGKGRNKNRSHSRWNRLTQMGWLLLALAASAVFIAAIPGYWSGFVFNFQPEPSSSLVRTMYFASTLGSMFAGLLSLVLAGLIFWRRPGDPMAQFVSAYMLVYGVVMAGPMEALEITIPVLAGFTVKYLQPMLVGTPTVLLLFTFPDGRIVPAWGKWVVLGSLGWGALLLIVSPDTIYGMTDPWVLILGIAWILSLPVAGIFAQVYRFRRVSSPIEREQTKWVVYGLAIWILLMIVQSIPYSFLSSLPPGDPLPWWVPISQAGWWLSLAIIPGALAISLLRFRLWDIDLVIRRTLQYTLLTGTLGLVYFGSVVVLQRLFDFFAGRSDSPLVTVLTTLSIAALFTPLRYRIQEFIDRRFYRNKYDAQHALAHFAAAARDEVDMDQLTAALLSVVEETVQPEQVFLWLQLPADQNRNGRNDV